MAAPRATALAATTASLRERRRDAALDRIVAYLLDHGLGNAGLRTLASAAGTSNRMLLYYFRDKDDLMVTAFACIVDRLSGRLAEMLPEGRQPFDVLLTQMWAMLKEPAFEPYLRVWYEALGRVSLGEELYRAMANRVLEIWFEWFEPRLDAPESERPGQIAAIVAAACGLVMVRYIGRAQRADDAATVLAQIARKSRGSTPLALARQRRKAS